MTLIQAIILGILQGLTEFLPISSSAHLVLVPYLLKWNIPQEQLFPFDVLIQMGTLVAVLIYFWKDLFAIIKGFFSGITQKNFFSPQTHLGWMIILGSIPGGLAGFFLKDLVEMVFHSPVMAAVFLLVTALLLFLAERFKSKRVSLEQLTWLDAVWIGVGQALAIFPGISRSGATISAGMFRNLDRYSAARFSFLLFVPIMLAAGFLSVLDLLQISNLGDFLPVMIAGFLTAGVVGYLSIHFLLRLVRNNSLVVFSAYCVIFSAFCLVILYVR